MHAVWSHLNLVPQDQLKMHAGHGAQAAAGNQGASAPLIACRKSAVGLHLLLCHAVLRVVICYACQPAWPSTEGDNCGTTRHGWLWASPAFWQSNSCTLAPAAAVVMLHLCRSLHQHLPHASSGGMSTAPAHQPTPIVCLEDRIPTGSWTLML